MPIKNRYNWRPVSVRTEGAYSAPTDVLAGFQGASSGQGEERQGRKVKGGKKEVKGRMKGRGGEKRRGGKGALPGVSGRGGGDQ